MNICEVHRFDLNKQIVKDARVILLGLEFEDHVISRTLFFASRNEFIEYCDSLTAIYEPHQRPRVVYVQYINEKNSDVVKQVRVSQDVKEMTMRAIRILDAPGQDASDLKKEFFDLCGEEIR